MNKRICIFGLGLLIIGALLGFIPGLVCFVLAPILFIVGLVVIVIGALMGEQSTREELIDESHQPEEIEINEEAERAE